MRDDGATRYTEHVRYDSEPKPSRSVPTWRPPQYLGYALPPRRWDENPSALPEQLPLLSATSVAPEAAPASGDRSEATMALPTDDLLQRLTALADSIAQLGKRQDELATRVTAQSQVLDRYLTASLPQLPMAAPLPALVGPAPGTSIQVVPPSQGGPPSAPFIPDVLPAMPPLVRRDIKKLVGLDASGCQTTIGAVEVITTTDPLTNEEKTETIQYRHRNRYGELVDHGRVIHACGSCQSLTNTVYHCTVCDRPMCGYCVGAARKLPAEGQPKAIRCCYHGSM